MAEFGWVFRTLRDLQEFASLNQRGDIASALEAVLKLETAESTPSALGNEPREGSSEPKSSPCEEQDSANSIEEDGPDPSNLP